MIIAAIRPVFVGVGIKILFDDQVGVAGAIQNLGHFHFAESVNDTVRLIELISIKIDVGAGVCGVVGGAAVETGLILTWRSEEFGVESG